MNRSALSNVSNNLHQFNRNSLLTGLLLAGAMAIATPASAALTQATIYEQPATAPSGALWIGGHLWVSDHISGFCRIDATATGNVINSSTCYNFGLGGAAGQPAFDALNNWIYLPDLSAKSQGVTRLQYDPATATVFPDSIVAPNAGLGGDRPDAAALGPDGNLYVSFKKNGNIVKLTNPGCVDSATVNCSNLQQKVSVGTSSDGKRVLNLAFSGSDLYLAETVLLTRIRNVALCTGGCKGFQTPVTVNQPQALAYDGQYLYVGNTTDVLRANLLPGGNPSNLVSYATGFAFVSGLAVNPLANVYAADDPSAGISANQGRWWTMPALP